MTRAGRHGAVAALQRRVQVQRTGDQAVATFTVGVVGPEDLVELVLALQGRTPEVSLVPFIYGHEEQASRLVATEQERVDGLLFTGIVPYVRASVDGVLR